MALKTRNKVNATFSMSSMTDIVFLLLIFFMVTSTLISPNALKLLLPKSSNQTAAKPITTVSIDKNFNFFLETTPVPFSQLEHKLQRKLAREDDPTISLHVDKSVPMEQVVKVMNIAKNNKYKLILATRAK
ncbi:biopolymer transporter ExbD [Marinifilum sp. N1E240]|uniref:ExbD/TolR family protein n=1 Tax=Marinifilum sp. N1E240 TaxID=2608082 RepID=UPI00128BA3D0|nr:biopolymer transporter ExbD [Marinifilum sp. N1E240]MPQ46037.1 biopolymer transporter ExbD [Marinifilum sp. N1E240]